MTAARALMGRPVVTLAGDDIAQVKDVVYAASDGGLVGFTLAGRGLLSGPLRAVLPWRHVHAAGPHAVMVADEDRLTGDPLHGEQGEADDVIGDTVLTTGGTSLGRVTDVIVDLGTGAEIVGFELETGEALAPAGRRVLIPRPDRGASSGEAIIVPEAIIAFVVNDVSSLPSAAASFRNQATGGS